MKLKDWLIIAFWTLVIAAGIAFIVFYFKSILTADIPLWLKLYLLGGEVKWPSTLRNKKQLIC